MLSVKFREFGLNIFIIFLFNTFFLTSCNRPSGSSTSTVNFKIASQKLTSRGFLDAYKPCYAVSITGDGISQEPRTCGPTLGTGTTIGFQPIDSAFTYNLLKGTNRTVSVYMYLAPKGQTTCPKLDSTFDDAWGTNFKSTFKVGEAITDMTSDITNVTIDVVDPATPDLNIVTMLGQDTLCVQKLSTYLYSNGTIETLNYSTGLTEAITSLAYAPIFNSFALLSFANLTDSSLVIQTTNGNILYMGNQISIPSFLHSIIGYPGDPTKIIGLKDDGSLMEVSLATGIGVDYGTDTTTCAFDICQVPVWLKSITFGPGRKLYGLDQSGGFYLLTANGPIPSGLSVPQAVEQVAF